MNKVIKQKLMVHEVIELVAKKRTRKDKVQVLRENKTGALLDILRGTYDNKIVWLLPEGPVPYTPNDGHNAPTNFLKSCTELAYFVKGGPWTGAPNYKREKRFIALLESIHPKDAELVVNMINKQKIDGVTVPAIKEAFPDLIKG